MGARDKDLEGRVRSAEPSGAYYFRLQHAEDFSRWYPRFGACSLSPFEAPDVEPGIYLAHYYYDKQASSIVKSSVPNLILVERPSETVVSATSSPSSNPRVFGRPSPHAVDRVHQEPEYLESLLERDKHRLALEMQGDKNQAAEFGRLAAYQNSLLVHQHFSHREIEKLTDLNYSTMSASAQAHSQGWTMFQNNMAMLQELQGLLGKTLALQHEHAGKYQPSPAA